jgi:hypothetical protein
VNALLLRWHTRLVASLERGLLLGVSHLPGDRGPRESYSRPMSGRPRVRNRCTALLVSWLWRAGLHWPLWPFPACSL